MEHRLAGQHSGDRRRRRMSSEMQDEELFHEFFPEVAAVRAHQAPALSAQGASIPLLRRLISPRLWKHAVLLIAGAVGVAAMLWWEHVPSDTSRARSQSMLSDAAVASRGLTGLLLLFSGQLALCTGLLRSTSLVDFQGRYRWWKWLAAGLIAAGMMVTTDTSQQVSDALVAMLQPFTGQIQAARQTLLLVPALTFCLIVLGRVLPDMTRSPLSLSLLVLAVLTFTVGLLLVRGNTAGQVNVATLSGLHLTAAYAVFAAMLLHCRFVAYVCHDPPEAARKQAQAHEPVADVDVRVDVSQEADLLAEKDIQPNVTLAEAVTLESSSRKKPKPTARKSRRAA